MDELKKKIEIINQIDENWIQNIQDENGYIRIQDEELGQAFQALFEETRKLYKENREGVRAEIQNLLKVDGEKFLKIVENSLVFFFAVEGLRQQQSEDKESVKKYLQFVFENVYIRFDPDFGSQYEKYQFQDIKSFVKTTSVLDTLTEFYVRKHYTRQAIKNDLMYESALAEDICEYYAELLEKNYLALQMNLVIDHIAEED